MKNEFTLAFNEVLEEKQLPKEIILKALESAMISAYRRAVNASNAQHVEATVDTDTGKVTIFAEKEVVEEVQDERTEVTLEEARRFNAEAELGDMVVVEQDRPPKIGDIVLAEVDGQWTMKYFRRQGGKVILEAANPAYPIIHPREELKIGGVITASVRKYLM